MKKLFCVIALAAISFSSVYAQGTDHSVKAKMQSDTTKKDKPTKKDTTKKNPPMVNQH